MKKEHAPSSDVRPLVRLSAPQESPGRSVEVDGPVAVIGSRRDCTLSVSHGDVSKLHAAVCNTGSELLVCDLRSRTGTFVNDQPVTAGRLRPGDRLRVGPVAVEVEFVRAPARAGSATAEAPRLPRRVSLTGSTGTFALSVQPAVIGRRNNCDVVLDTPDVSLAHALIFSLDGSPTIFDLGSRSGTLINGERVALAPLRDGDELNIGGELLRVCCEAPAERAPARGAAPQAREARSGDGGGGRDAIEETLAAGAEAAASAVGAGAAPGELIGLESTIVALQSQMAGLRSRLEQRAQELDRREADIDALAEALAEDRASLDKSRAALQAERVQAERAAQIVDQRRKALLESVRACREQRRALQASAAENERMRLEAQRLHDEAAARVAELEGRLAAREAELSAAFAEREAELERQQAARVADLERQQAGLDAARQAAEALERELAQRQSDLEAQEAAVRLRLEEIAQREQASVEALRKIEQLRAALEGASQAFADMASASALATSGTASDARPAAVRPGTAPAAISGSAGAGEPSASPPAHADADAPAPLPAPIVDEPVFTAPAGLGELPPEARERFQVLRRVSGKSDDELMAQVSAEHAARQAKVAAEAAAPRPRRRGWWS